MSLLKSPSDTRQSPDIATYPYLPFPHWLLALHFTGHGILPNALPTTVSSSFLPHSHRLIPASRVGSKTY
ncbi:hypothetical protein [Yersinia similis]|uniref:hypothetical protein n=1 Tax=Yersinia similis TaxID=367190 RepID=UPI00164382B4|nr:hypothetical protein [Yersinia similis]